MLGSAGARPLAMEFDVTIIGNGAVASALALRFVEEHPELRLALVGPARRTGSASLAAGAMLNVFAELEAGALDSPLARARFEAAVAASALWAPHLAALNARLVETAPVRVVPGTHVIAGAGAASKASLDEDLDDDLDSVNLDAIAGYLAEYRQRFREVDPRSIEGLAPAASAQPRRALLLEDEGSVSPRHLHRAYDEAFAGMPQLRRFDAEATALSPSGDPSRATTTVQLGDGRVLATRHVLLAAGARTQPLIDALGLHGKIPRLVHGVGVSLVLKTAAALPRTVVRTPRRGLAAGLYLVPYLDGHCYLGATSELRASSSSSSSSGPSVRAVHALLGAALEQISPALADAQLHKTLVGARPTTLDGYPLLGQTSIAGVWIASGTKRDGLHLSPKIAVELVAAIAKGTTGAAGAQPFAGRFVPERPLLLPPGRAAAIARAVAQRLAIWPAAAGPAPSADELGAQLEELYRGCGLDALDVGIPPELLELYRDGVAGDNLAHLLAQRARPPA